MAKLVNDIGLETPITVYVGGIMPENMTAAKGFEGPQIVVNWGRLDWDSIQRIRLVRRTTSWPLDIADGKVLLTCEHTPFNTSFVDADVAPGVVYYYTLFVQDLSTHHWLFDARSMKSQIAIDTGTLKSSFFSLLPGMYRMADQGKL